MALIKEKQLNNGAIGNYWVAEPRIDKLKNKTRFILYLFKDEATRRFGGTYLHKETFLEADEVYMSGEEVYTHLTQSIIREGINRESGELESMETNFFVDAESDE